MVPFGRIDRVNPPPSASLLGLAAALAFLIVVSVSGMCGQPPVESVGNAAMCGAVSVAYPTMLPTNNVAVNDNK